MNDRRSEKHHDIVIKLLMCVCIAILIELVICNYRSLESVGWKQYDLMKDSASYLKDGQYKNGSAIIAPFREDNWCDVTVFVGNKEVKNIYLVCQYLDVNYQPIEKSYVTVYMKIQDEGNKILYQLPDRVVVPEIKRTHYNRINPSGKLNGFELTFLKPGNSNVAAVEISECKFNKQVPLQISVIRIGIILFFVLSLYYLHPGSSIYKISFSQKFEGKRLLIVLSILFCLFFSLFFANINSQYYYRNYKTQYHDLVEAFLNGHTYLDEAPAEALATMDNPYDTRFRDEVLREAGESYRLDWAYYNNKYYVYFGVVPVLLTFLPYYVITGSHLSVTIAISIFGIMYIVGCFALLWVLFKRKFSESPFVLYLLSCGMLLFCSGMFYAFRGPAFYGLPILAAAAFAVWGIYFWYAAIDDKNHRIILYKVLAGSLCVSLTAGCRPQFLVIMVIAFFIYREYIFDKAYLISKKGIKLLISGILPILLVAIGIMCYNAMRFGSPLDFGSNYNLTSNDMTHRGWHWDRTFLGIYMYLFDPTKISAVFPFILDSIKSMKDSIPFTNYMGATIFEGNFGGIVFNHPILFLPFLSVPLRKYCEKNTYRISCFFLFSAVIVLVVDTQMAGLVGRYLMDFGWLLCFASILLFLSVEKNSGNDTLKAFIRTGILLSLFWGGIYEFLLAFNEHTNSLLKVFCPSLYYNVQALVQFWL